MFDSFGLDISDLSIKFIYLKPHLVGMKLAGFGEIRVPEGAIVDGEVRETKKVNEVLLKLLSTGGHPPRFVNASLPDSKTFIKLLEIPHKEKLGEEEIRQELVNHIPLPVDQLTIDWQVISDTLKRKGQTPAMVKVLVAASETATVNEYTALLRSVGLVPLSLEVEAQAILRATVSKDDCMKKGNGAIVIIDLGQTQTNIIFFENRAILFTNSLKLSGEELTRKIAEKLSLSFEQAEKAKIICGLNPKKCKGIVKKYLEDHITALASEIKKSQEFYTTHFNKTGKLQKVILVGGGANLKDLDVTLDPLLGVLPEYGNVCTNLPPRVLNLDKIGKAKIMSYATAIGLALRNV